MASASAAQYLSEILLDELESYSANGSDGAHCSWIMLLPLGTYEHPKGTLNLTRAMLSEVKRNFDQKVRGVELALDYDHKASEGDSRAFGWLKSVEIFDAGHAPLKRATDHPAGLWALVEWTRIGLDAVKDHIYRYISAEYRPEWTNPVNNKTYKNVLIGATLTNRPFMNHMPAVQLTEFSTTPWGQIDKSKLPSSAFLDPKNRRLPVREASGKLNIHGVRAALAAVHGAHTGHAMSGLPDGTAEKLERWIAGYEQSGTMSAEDDDQENTQMSSGPSARGVHLNKYLASADTSDEDEAEDYDLEDDEDDTDDLAADEGDVDDDYEMDDSEDEEDAADGGDDEAAEGEPTEEPEEGEPSASGRTGRSRNKGGRRRPARQKAQRGSTAMSERQEDTLTLAEAQALREKAAQADVALREIAELRASRDEMAIRLFEQAIDGKIQAWEAPANGEAGKVITTTAFNNEYKAFMLSEGFGLSESTRQKVDHLLDLALAGIVELGQRSLATADMESRLTRNAAQSTDDRGVGERIEAIALEETGKPWKTLLREAEGNVKLQAANREIMKRAWRETGYTARQFGADVAAAASTTFRD